MASALIRRMGASRVQPILKTKWKTERILQLKKASF